MSQAVPHKPSELESGYSVSQELLDERATKEKEPETFWLTVCAEVDGCWQKGYQKELSDRERQNKGRHGRSGPEAKG